MTEIGWRQANAIVDLFGTSLDLIVVSPYVRAHQTAEPAISRFPGVMVETWPIQEFTYLDQAKCVDTTYQQRRPIIEAYWFDADPLRIDAPACESFAGFIRSCPEV